MKARRKGDAAPFDDVYQIIIGRGLNAKHIPINDVEFEQQQEPTSDHWQDVRERAAIAAMQSIIPTQKGEYMICDEYKQYDDCAREAVRYADALVAKLKGE